MHVEASPAAQVLEAHFVTIETSVMIVGAGPVGLGLAVDLGWRGVPCVVVEQTDGTVRFPRANAVNVRTMEFCRRWGIAEKVREAAIHGNSN